MSEDTRPVSFLVLSLEEQTQNMGKKIQELEDKITVYEAKINNLKTNLKVEKFKSNLLYNIIANNTEIKLSEIYREDEDGIHLQNFETGNVSVFVKEYLGEAEVKHTIAAPKFKKKRGGNFFRSVKTVEENNEQALDQEEKIKKAEGNIEKLAQRHFDISKKDTIEMVDNLFNEIEKTKSNNTALESIKATRLPLIGKMSLEEYIKLVKTHITRLDNILTKKKFDKKKIVSTIQKSLSPLEQRLTSYGQYYNSDIETTDDIAIFKASLKVTTEYSKTFIPFSLEFYEKRLMKYSLALLPLKEVLTKIFSNPFGFSNIIYLNLEKSTDTDPYSFYTLGEIKEGKRFWKMECRLFELSKLMAQHLRLYCVTLFRKIYLDVFNDNIYRENYKDTAPILRQDSEQLLFNIVLLTKQKSFCDVFRKIICKHCTINQTTLDKFNFTADDQMVKKHFSEEEDDPEELFTCIKSLFDNLTKEEYDGMIGLY